MSFDVFVQRMVDGELAVADSDAVRALIDPYVRKVEPESDFAELAFDDGTADLYGFEHPGKGFMVNHVSGRLAWDLVAQVAAQEDMTLMAPGVPPMICHEATRAHLPDGLGDGALVVTSGADILRALAEADDVPATGRV